MKQPLRKGSIFDEEATKVNPKAGLRQKDSPLISPPKHAK
jgi:hypothetical protein